MKYNIIFVGNRFVSSICDDGISWAFTPFKGGAFNFTLKVARSCIRKHHIKINNRQKDYQIVEGEK